MITSIVQAITETMPISSSAHLKALNCDLSHITHLHLYTAAAGALYFFRYIKLKELAILSFLQVLLYLVVKPILPGSIIGIASLISGIALILVNQIPESRDFSLNIRSTGLFIAIQTLGFISGISRLGSALFALKLLRIKNPWPLAVLAGVPLSIGSALHERSISFSSDGLLCFAIAYLFYHISHKISLKYYGLYKIIFGLIIITFTSIKS